MTYRVDGYFYGIDGYFGPYCPICGKRGGSFIGDTNKVKCSYCKWTGEYKELLNSEEEYKNTKRTKLIDRMTNA